MSSECSQGKNCSGGFGHMHKIYTLKKYSSIFLYCQVLSLLAVLMPYSYI